MAENIFFDLLKEKMTFLRPSLRHSDEDWASLSARLDMVLPQLLQEKRRALLPLFFLFFALLSSNLFWWQECQNNQIVVQRIEAQLEGLKTTIFSLKPLSSMVCTDTVWRTVVVRQESQEQSNNSEKAWQGIDAPLVHSTHLVQRTTAVDNYTLRIQNEIERQFKSTISNKDGLTSTTSELSVLEAPEFQRLKTSIKATPFAPNMVATPIPKNNPRPLGALLANALKPKFGKVGLVSGWLYPLNASLLHQSGFEAGVQGIIGFTRNWGILLEFTYGQLHYEASDPKAIWGSPDYPLSLSPDEHFTHLDLKGQSLRQFRLGIQYSFSQPGKLRPYAGLSWGNQTVMPYPVVYEIEQEPNNTRHQGTFDVYRHTHLRNILRVDAGFEVPISPRINCTAEGFYSRRWATKNMNALGMTGIRAGINWTF